MSCFSTKMCLVRISLTDRCERICFFNLIVVKFECKYRVCVCSLVVVRHIVYYERFSDFKAGVSCFSTKMRLVSINSTDRCGRIYFF